MPHSVSLIATTYNQPADLDLYLGCLRKQTFAEFQIIIADDGSTPHTQEVIARHQTAWAKDRLLHVWHEDLGYRKSKIVNEAVRRSKGNWLIFTDSDHIVHPRFVEDHVRMQSKKTLFMGRRIDLSPQMSGWIRENPQLAFGAEFYARLLLSTRHSPSTRNVHRVIRITGKALANALGCDHVPDLLGSNFSIDRDLFFSVNGFNEESQHYWGEDGDLFARITHCGATIRGRKNYAVQLHLWHPQRTPQPDAEESYRRKLDDADYRSCRRGIINLESNDSFDTRKVESP